MVFAVQPRIGDTYGSFLLPKTQMRILGPGHSLVGAFREIGCAKTAQSGATAVIIIVRCDFTSDLLTRRYFLRHFHRRTSAPALVDADLAHHGWLDDIGVARSIRRARPYAPHREATLNSAFSPRFLRQKLGSNIAYFLCVAIWIKGHSTTAVFPKASTRPSRQQCGPYVQVANTLKTFTLEWRHNPKPHRQW